MTEVTYQEAFRRGALRSTFHSLFWGVIVDRKRKQRFKMKDLADTLGVNKSFISRSFSSPPNWRIDTLADFADALDLDLIVEAKDRKTGRVFTPSGLRSPPLTTTSINLDGWNVQVDVTATKNDSISIISAAL